MTIGEYGKMINGQFWMKDSVQCILEVIPCKNYTHQMRYSLPVPPSPNLKSDASKFLTFKTRIFRSQNIEGDPRLKCVDYSKENTYYDCIQNEMKNFFNMTIGCLPPPLSQEEPDIMCNQNFMINSMEHVAIEFAKLV